MNGQAIGPDLLRPILSSRDCEGTCYVAFSGGLDSTALLTLMHALAPVLGWRLAAVHINHGYHPNAADWEAHCQQVCAQLGIEFHSIKVSADPGSGAGPEAELRNQRYAAFEALLKAGDLLLLAHHRDDQAETLLLNLMRGSGVNGLAGIPQSRSIGAARLLRPLLDFSRAQLQAYLESGDTAWLQDPGNRDDEFDRNFLRNQVLPLISERWPAAHRSLARSADHCREAATALAELANTHLEARLHHGRVLSLDEDLLADEALLRLLLRSWTQGDGAPSIPHARMLEFCRQLAASNPTAQLELAWEGWSIRRFHNRLWLHGPQAPPPCPDQGWSGENSMDLGTTLGTVSLISDTPGSFPNAVQIRQRGSGDTIRLPTGPQHHSVKELMRQAGVPPWLRASIPLLCRGGEILAVGDWALSPQLLGWLQEQDARLHWEPGDPALELVRRECHREAVESSGVVG